MVLFACLPLGGKNMMGEEKKEKKVEKTEGKLKIKG
jgi:hypothetical protein